MKLFVHTRVTLQYFNFKGRMNLKGLLHSFSDNCCRVTAGGNEIDPYLNHHDHSFKGSLDL